MACLIPEYANKFLDGLKKGEINPESLSDMTSEQRRNLLAKYVGKENAKFVNTEFESKLLLKNQKEGMINWAKKMANLKPEARKDLIAKIEKLDKALSPENEGKILSDIVERRLRVQVTPEEAQTIVDLTAKLKENYNQRLENGNPYGKYKQQIVEFMRDHTPPRQYPTVLSNVVGKSNEVLSVLRSIKTGFDLSASLRQGASYFGTKQWNNAFLRMFGYAKSKVAFDELEASFYNNKYSDQAMAVKNDLGLTMLGESYTHREEQFLSKFTKHVPFLNGAERAYEGFLNDVRFNRFVDILGQLDKAGNGITNNKQAMKDLARVIATATGRGELGKFEQSANGLATVLFSPRWLVSKPQMITNIFTKKGVARVEAAKALARQAGLAVAIIGLAKMAGGDVDDDPRSSKFGKLKIGNTSFDLTFGMSPYIVLATRIIREQTKSAATGKVTNLNTGEYGSKTSLDIAGDFITSRTSPVASIVRDYLKGEDFSGNKVGLSQPPIDQVKFIADSLITPLTAADTIEAFKEASGENKIVMGVAAFSAGMFGIGASTYASAPGGKQWDALKEEKGQKVYDSAVKDYNIELRKQLESLQATEEYINAKETPEEDAKENRADMIDKVREKTSKMILREYY